VKSSGFLPSYLVAVRLNTTDELQNRIDQLRASGTAAFQTMSFALSEVESILTGYQVFSSQHLASESFGRHRIFDTDFFLWAELCAHRQSEGFTSIQALLVIVLQRAEQVNRFGSSEATLL